MKTYELTYIIASALDTKEAETIQNEIVSLIQAKEGVIVHSNKMGAQPLSYVIKKQHSGNITTQTFQLDESKAKEIKETLDKNPSVLRSMFVEKKPLREKKERRTRKPMTPETVPGKKPSIMESILKKPKAVEQVNTEDLNKKLDELLGS